MAIKLAPKERYDTEDLLEIMRLLRSPDGCPWDREQTHRSIRGDFLEETYEALEAIDREDVNGLQEELGDVLLQVVFHALIAADDGEFTYDDVVDTLCRKLISRHQHVFGDVQAADAGEALRSWDAAKRAHNEGKTQTQLLQGVVASLPALMRASKVLGRARRVGLEPVTDAQQGMQAVQDAVDNLQSAVNDNHNVDRCIGDLLFATVMLSRVTHSDSEEQLSLATNRFIDRFAAIETQLRADGCDIGAVSAAQWQDLWEQN